ncbi:MFS transporter [Actinosynnema sp. CS-041913]|uniref:MFS transporter n=1 Tax=Actinosynnema sp. CS-041913 TaxID=3239917 RepID=UPI003D8D8FF3
MRPALWARSPTVGLLAGATLVNSFGNGLFMVASLLFFTRVVGLEPVAVGIALTVAEYAGLATAVPIGRAADRFGAKPVLQALLLVQGGATALFLLPDSVGWFAATAVVYSIGQKAARGVNNALIADVAGPDDRTVVRAHLRAMNNLGMSLGALAAGLAVAADSRAAYSLLFAVDALTFVGAAVFLARVRWRPAGATGAPAPGRSALRDPSYLRLTALNAVVSLHYSVLIIGLPLWIADRTSVPDWTLSPLLALNTAMVVLLQVRVSRRITSVRTSAAYLKRAAGLFLISVPALGCAALGSPVVAIVLLVAGVVVHTIAEIWHAAAAFEASVARAVPGRQGDYQSVFALGQGISESLAPALLVTLGLGLGVPGWLLLGAALAAGALLMAVSLDPRGRKEEGNVDQPAPHGRP